MAGWIIAVALGSVAITALLAWVLWRLNAPLGAAGDSETKPPATQGSGDAA